MYPSYPAWPPLSGLDWRVRPSRTAAVGGGSWPAATRRGFRQSYLGWVRAEVGALLRRGAAGECATMVGVCRELVAVEQALYTFAAAE